MNLFSVINREKDITVIPVTHSAECAKVSDRTVLPENGHINITC